MPWLGILCALRSEARAFRRGAAQQNYLLGTSGVGPARVVETLEDLRSRGASTFVSFGFAGGLAPRLRPGDLVIASSVSTPGGSIVCLPAPLPNGLTATATTLLSTDTLAATAAAKARLHAGTGCEAVDMESQAIARYCQCHQLPFVAVRAVLDTAASDLPFDADELIDERGRLRVSRLAATAVRQPRTLWAIRAAERSARRALTRAASLLTA